METRDEIFQNRSENTQLKQADVTDHPDYYLNDKALAELRDFCDSFDPYMNMDLETKFRLQEYGVVELSNPFEITTTLLLLLENNLQ